MGRRPGTAVELFFAYRILLVALKNHFQCSHAFGGPAPHNAAAVFPAEDGSLFALQALAASSVDKKRLCLSAQIGALDMEFHVRKDHELFFRF